MGEPIFAKEVVEDRDVVATLGHCAAWEEVDVHGPKPGLHWMLQKTLALDM